MPNAIGIVGVDGSTPVYQPDARWTMWSIHEIYMGQVGQNRVIPKISDYVIEPETGTTYIVSALDNITYIPTLSPVNIQNSVTTDSLLSSTNDNYRIYYDKSVSPYTLAVDGLLRVYSSTSSYARVYQGNFIDPSKIISRRYDNNGNFIADSIPLALVAFNSHDNYSIKSIPTCNTLQELTDGEICTVVVFDNAGKVLTKVSCILEETTFVAQAYAEQKYITQIFLKTPFINISQQNEINYPVNLPVESFNPIGVVQYNDATQVEFPVDGDKFRLYGLDQFLSTIIGHRVPLVLSYRMDATEAALASVQSDNYYITRPYSLIVSNPNTSYNVKLFIYPIWVDNLNGYSLKAYLMNLDRNLLIDVTDKIAISTNSPAFNPLRYGITQRIIFSIELSNVSGIYNNYLHVQTVDIVLRGPASDLSLTNVWEVGSQVPSTVPYFGTNLRTIVDPTIRTKVRIDNGIATVEEFINKLYNTTSPLFNPVTEIAPITPTHIEIRWNNANIIVPISQYTQEFVFPTPVTQYANIDIIFLKQTYSGYLQLSVASLVAR